MKLMDQVRHRLRLLRYAWDTEKSYVRWVERYLQFHRTGGVWRHPRDMGGAEVEQFLGYLAQDRHVSASTQNQALGALLFLYQKVLEIELPRIDALRARRTKRLPVVLSPGEVKELLAGLSELKTREPYALMCRLMYGTGMRVMECCRLRVKDLDFQRKQIVVRQGKGDKDRVVPLPVSVRDELNALTLISELGTDMTMWPTVKHLTSWLGLCPNFKKTGGKVKSSHTRRGKGRAAYTFRLAAWSLIRSKSYLGANLRRQRSRLGAPKAITAAAHKLARIFYTVLRYGVEYQKRSEQEFGEEHRKRMEKHLHRRAREMGYKLVPVDPPGQPTAA